ncbi:hypothetical protein INR49_026676 [Caranx melampygus]|nr:hypothetical protein INR49_026676 [Caranx melampygus]
MADMEKPTKAAGVGVFLELRKKLQSGLLIVGKDVARNPADVTVTGGDSSLHIRTPQGELTLTLPAGVTLEQGSCIPTPAGASCGEELHYRLRINVAQGSDEGIYDSVMEILRAKETYCFYCQGCMTRMLEDRVFKRVLPLPNGNWNAIVDDWCCHPDPFANKSYCPEQKIVYWKPCRRLTLVSCKSCYSVLGEAVAPGTLKLYITQVVVEPTVGDRKPDTSLWLLNSDSVIASVPEMCVLGESSVSSPALHSPSPRAARALKLLYIACSDTEITQRDIVTSWEVNAIGHPVVLPLTVCEELLSVVDDCNSTLPASMRCMRSYEVAYLRL